MFKNYFKLYRSIIEERLVKRREMKNSMCLFWSPEIPPFRSLLQIVLLIGLLSLLASCNAEQEKHTQADGSSVISTALAQPEEDSQTQDTSEDLHTSRHNAITRAVARVSPAVVGINVIQVQRFVRRSPFDDPFWRNLFPELYRDRVYEREVKSLGSGFLISRDGYVVTNEHVIENASKIVVTMTNGQRYNAEMMGGDRLTDIALLKIEGDDFPYIEFGDSDDILVGEWSIALGNPFGLFELNDQPTVTVGVVSAVDRDWGSTGDGRLYMDMIQTDAAINHGNSGGPLVNSLSQVIGMNTFIYTGSQYEEGSVGIGFAIPIDKVEEIITELKETGGIDREYWMGILDIQTLTPQIAAALDAGVQEGVIISQLDRRGPAYKAGLRVYDVIVALSGKEIRTQKELLNTLQNMDLKVGDVLEFTVIRNGKKLNFKVKLEHMP